MPLKTAFLSILAIPFFTFLLLLFCRNLFGKKSTILLTLSATMLGLVITIFGLKPAGMLINEGFRIGQEAMDFNILMNKETILMLVIVHIVALLVQFFSVSYMADDEGFNRYFAFIQFFIFAMIGVVLAGNLLLLYAFWELVGLASYLLIGFWYQKDSAIKASKKAFIFNRIGDAGFLAGIGLLYYIRGSLSLDFSGNIEVDNTLTIIGILLFCGTIGKSAQFPLQVWLPDAMEGPTPVSALIHAATMVAAGVFLLIRIFPILTPEALFFISIIGIITMLTGGIVALFQTDIKKLLAFSTISQLGLMVLAVGLGSPMAAFFHLTTHAFFKAGLFLGAGAIIHTQHTQNMNEMGGLYKRFPLITTCYIIFTAALIGMPFFSGFLSKEMILSVAETKPVFLALILLNSALTATYMSRQILLVFFGEAKTEVHEHWSVFIYLPLIILAIASLGFVFNLNPFVLEGNWFSDLFEIKTLSHGFLLPLLSIFAIAVGLMTGLFLVKKEKQNGLNKIQLLMANQFNINEMYGNVLVKPTFLMAKFTIKTDVFLDAFIHLISNAQMGIAAMIAWFDEKIIDGIVDGFSFLISKIGKLTETFQAKSSVFSMIVGLIIIVFFWLIKIF
jgi:NADH-quinone oxidoreductase subunit L